MSTITVPFRLPGFRIAQAQATSDTTLVIIAHANARSTRCPQCQQSSRRVHSYYVRTPHDLPITDRAVQLRLHVRRFTQGVPGLTPQCSQQTFAERLPTVVPVAARRTTRLTARLQTLALALGGEAGARVSQRLHLPVSPDTLLRVLRQTPCPTAPTPRVLGVDDFALRKGSVYGTILVDLERQCAVDLLPDRTAATLRDWLAQHPGVEIIARDRSTEYAHGATAGAPAAMQVADRWHLLHNLREALERLLYRRHALLARLPPPSLQPVQGDGDGQGVCRQTALRIPSASEQLRSATARDRRLADYHAVRALHAEGLDILQIAKRLRMSRSTVRKYVHVEAFPERAPHPRAEHARSVPHISASALGRWLRECNATVA